MKLARHAHYQKASFYNNGGSLYIWTTNESRADIQCEDITIKQARQIARTYGIEKLKITAA